MAAISLAGRSVNLEISPWFDKGYVFNSLRMNESIGGKMASGVIHLTSNGKNVNLSATDTEVKIKLLQPSSRAGNEILYEITGWIYMRKVAINEVYLSFIAVKNNEFTTVSRVNKFKDKKLKDIITELYPGEVEFVDDIEADVPDVLSSIDQNGHTDYDLCDRLCRSFKKDVIYSFGLEKLVLKPRDRSDEPYKIVAETTNVTTDLNTIGYYKEMELEPEGRNKSVNLNAQMYGFKYMMSRGDYHRDLYEVYLHNERYYTGMKCSLVLKYQARLPKFKVGDIVVYDNRLKFNNGKKYIVTAIDIIIDNNLISMNCSLSGWEDVDMGGNG